MCDYKMFIKWKRYHKCDKCDKLRDKCDKLRDKCDKLQKKTKKNSDWR